jgi:hypothetical protein
MNATKIQTTIISHPKDPLRPADLVRLIERLQLEGRRFMQERGYCSPGCVITQLDEVPDFTTALCGKEAA